MCAAQRDTNFLELAEIIRNRTSPQNLSGEQINQAIQQGFAAMLYQRFDSSILQNTGLNEPVKRLRQIALINEATALVRFEAMEVLINLACSRNIKILLMKGAALSYQLYPSPGCRASSDMDILIDESDIDLIQSVFVELGYALDVPKEKSMLSFQFSALKQSDTGHTLVFDIHYRINNNSQYEQYFDFDDLCKYSVALAAFDSVGVRALSFADAYTFACVHLQGHLMQGDPIKAIWLYDIHLLLSRLSDSDEQRILAQFERLGRDDLGSACRYWTEKARVHFNTEISKLLQSKLETYSDVSTKQVSNPVNLLWQQARHLPNNRARLVFLKQLFIPSRERIAQKYPGSTLWLPLLYVRRMVDGLGRRLMRTRK